MSDNIPQDLKYTKEHEWARITGKTVVVGVTHHAQESLGDVVYVELPKLGATLTEGKNFGVIESTKAVSDLFAPISGTVVKVNDELTNSPALINSDPYGQGWIVEIEPSDAGQVGKLLDAAAYEPLTK
ncbi:glycine cleavage system protein GcvH [Corallococcus sp. CA054B]|uniref:Glycine cleavage system H protein n=1 Tax=Corallococcus coralloides (strain ATCC 25202 / DSM 2259 / NBRC 100086 / M2) TaxID=1144275 RepID=H8MPW9_CORCM|nr:MULTISPECIES: glycine cleavage system protein GcvH [Corallococcus]AFE08891.1 glycine cleavage system protein H [Corallococcus coralloides DSM 2259]RKG69739.1 glycine cleavage system protein GcvH [Corallococcus sp. CA054B]